MMAFLHGFQIGMWQFFLLYFPFILLGYLLRDKISRRTTKLVWIGVQTLAIGCCDLVYCLVTSWDRLYPILVAWVLGPMFLGHGLAAIVQFVRKENRKEDAP